VLYVRPAGDERDLHIGKGRAGEDAPVLLLAQVREDEALPAPVKVVLGADREKAQAAPLFARLQEQMHLRIVAQWLVMADALDGGLEWGGGFTQFPADFSVQEADENTGRIEVTVVDTTSANALLCFSTSQIQATAFSINSLLNPRIDTVIYHVNVHMSSEGTIQKSSLFGFLTPTGDLSPFITFIWTKTTTPDGQAHFNCMISGVDTELEETLRNQIVGNRTTEDKSLDEATART